MIITLDEVRANKSKELYKSVFDKFRVATCINYDLRKLKLRLIEGYPELLDIDRELILNDAVLLVFKFHGSNKKNGYYIRYAQLRFGWYRKSNNYIDFQPIKTLSVYMIPTSKIEANGLELISLDIIDKRG